MIWVSRNGKRRVALSTAFAGYSLESRGYRRRKEGNERDSRMQTDEKAIKLVRTKRCEGTKWGIVMGTERCEKERGAL